MENSYSNQLKIKKQTKKKCLQEFSHKIMIWSSSYWSSAIHLLENQVFYWDLLIMCSMIASYQQLELTSKLEQLNPQEVLSNFKSGTLLDNKNSKLSLLHITKVLKDFYSCSISQTESHLLTYKIGCHKQKSMQTKRLSNYLLETSLIKKPIEKFLKNKQWDLLLQWEWSILRHQQKLHKMFKNHSLPLLKTWNINMSDKDQNH